jgi:hypothetical protein
MPTLDVQEPCACRTSQGFSYACSHQAGRLTNPRGCSRSRNYRALLTLTSDPICYIRLDAAHRVHPVLSQLLPARAKNVDLHRDLLDIKTNMPQQNYIYSRGTSGCFTRQVIIPNFPINRPANSRFWPGPESDRPSITETGNCQMPISNASALTERNIRMVRIGRLPNSQRMLLRLTIPSYVRLLCVRQAKLFRVIVPSASLDGSILDMRAAGSRHFLSTQLRVRAWLTCDIVRTLSRPLQSDSLEPGMHAACQRHDWKVVFITTGAGSHRHLAMKKTLSAEHTRPYMQYRSIY